MVYSILYTRSNHATVLPHAAQINIKYVLEYRTKIRKTVVQLLQTGLFFFFSQQK